MFVSKTYKLWCLRILLFFAVAKNLKILKKISMDNTFENFYLFWTLRLDLVFFLLLSNKLSQLLIQRNILSTRPPSIPIF